MNKTTTAKTSLIAMTFFGLLIIQLNVFGQSENKSIDTAWSLLKDQFLRRSNLAIQLSGNVRKNKNFDTLLSIKLENAASNLASLLQIHYKLDSNLIIGIHGLNDSLTSLIQKGLMIFENENSFTSEEENMDYLMQLEGNENRIHVCVHDFNKTCENLRRLDLCF